MVGVAVLVVAITSPLSQAVELPPTTIIRPGDSWADIQFSRPYHFTRIRIGTNYAVFEDALGAVTFGIEKLPRAEPRADILVTLWEPKRNAARAVEFTATAQPGSLMWFNFSGLHSYTSYFVFRDGELLQEVKTNALGDVDFSWSDWSSHIFHLAYEAPPSDGGLPPPGPPGPTLTNQQAWLVLFFLSAGFVAVWALTARRRP